MTLAWCFLCHTFCFIVCGIFSGIESGGFLIDCVLLYRGCRYIYQEGVRILLAGLTPPHLCDCPKPGFITPYVVIFLSSTA